MDEWNIIHIVIPVAVYAVFALVFWALNACVNAALDEDDDQWLL